jgi:hypothetical protein
MAYTQREGIKIARKHVGDLPEGTISTIITHGKNHHESIKWVYGRDPFPAAIY